MNDIYVKELLGFNLKRIRKQKNISQGELAEKVNLAFTFISDIENGKKWVSAETIEKFSKVLDVEIYQFFLPKDYIKQSDYNLEQFSNELHNFLDKLEGRYLLKK